MIKIKTKKRWFKKDEFKITDYDVRDLYHKVVNLDQLKTKHKDLVLQLDGGGMKGLHPALNLYIVEDKAEMKLNNYFKTIWGTSTGAIIAGLVAIGVPAKEILDLYVEKLPSIFDKTKGGMINIFSRSAYSSKYVDSLFDSYLGLKTFKDVSNSGVDLNISIVDPIQRVTKICNVKNCPDMHIKTAIRASMSAPMYFGPFIGHDWNADNKIEDFIYFDGGTGNYNSTLEKAICKELYKEKKKVEDFYVYSIGCGKLKLKKESLHKQIKHISKFRKIRQALWTIDFGREESIKRQVKWANYRVEDIGLNFKRVDFFIPKELDKMDKTDNIDDLINIIQKQMRD